MAQNGSCNVCLYSGYYRWMDSLIVSKKSKILAQSQYQAWLSSCAPVKSLNSGILLTLNYLPIKKQNLWKQGIQEFFDFHDVSKIYASSTSFYLHKHENLERYEVSYSMNLFFDPSIVRRRKITWSPWIQIVSTLIPPSGIFRRLIPQLHISIRSARQHTLLPAKAPHKRDREDSWTGGLVGVEADPIGAGRMVVGNPRPVSVFSLWNSSRNYIQCLGYHC